jgi:tetratricopeptide (TPR) repeat protein
VFCKRAGTAALLAIILSACSRQDTANPPRIAILRFENLTSDASLDWMGRAASEIIGYEVGHGHLSVISAATMHASPIAQFRPVAAPGESAEIAAAIADGATRIVIGQISVVRDRLLLNVTERDAASGKTAAEFTVTSTNAGDFYGAVDLAARKLSSEITPFDSRNAQAIAFWGRALEESDYGQKTSDYSRAVQADPNFASAWLGWARQASSHRDATGAAKVLEEAQRHAGQFSELNRARLKLSRAELSGDRAATLAAMNELGRIVPDDVDNTRSIADQNFAARQYADAVTAYRRLTRLTPHDALVWNQLGYNLMYTGDYDGAMAALRTYQQMSPQDVNPLDSQGDVAFAFGRFQEAEKLYDQASAKDPSFESSSDLYKAAQARLMTGDVAGADRKFAAYLAARRAAQDAAVPYRAAHWQFLEGKHEEALTALGGIKSPQLAGPALTQMAVWNLQLGHRDRALEASTAALKSGSVTPVTLIVRFACENAQSAAEWSAAADRVMRSPQLQQLKPVALGYALYLAHEWQAAEPIWKQLEDRAGPDDSLTPVIYARALVELKKAKEAAPLVRLFPIPHPNSSLEFLSLAIPEVFEVRAAVAGAEGKPAEAEESRKIFRTLWPEVGSK